MKILGVGNDIIEIERIQGVIDRHGQPFLDKVFSAKEQEYCLAHAQSTRHFAGRFAAKEAIVKALGTGLREGISWLDFEILNDLMGKPKVILSSDFAQRIQDVQFMISISHCKEYATAFAICFAPSDL